MASNIYHTTARQPPLAADQGTNDLPRYTIWDLPKDQWQVLPEIAEAPQDDPLPKDWAFPEAFLQQVGDFYKKNRL